MKRNKDFQRKWNPKQEKKEEKIAIKMSFFLLYSYISNRKRFFGIGIIYVLNVFLFRFQFGKLNLLLCLVI